MRLQQGREDLEEGVDHDPPRPLKAELRRLRETKNESSFLIENLPFRACLLLSTFFFFFFISFT